MRKMLTPSEVQKLPKCLLVSGDKCDHEHHPNIDFRECIMCRYAVIMVALEHENICRATYTLVSLMGLLKEKGLLPKDAKP